MRRWFQQQFHRRAERGGETWFGKQYRGGAFLPFYVPRPVMPQIEEADYPEFIEFAAERGVELIVRYLEPNVLHPHQRLDKFKVQRMPEEVATKTVFVSSECFILDGNHRWMFHTIRKTRVPCFKIPLSFNDAIALMFEFPKTYSLETRHDAD